MGLIVGEEGPADLDDQKRVIKRPQCEKRVESTQQGCGWLDFGMDSMVPESVSAAVTGHHKPGGSRTIEIYFSQFWRLGSPG